MADTPLHIGNNVGPVPRIRRRTRSDRAGEAASQVRARPATMEPRIRIARALALALFVVIIFIAGLFVGTSFVADAPSLPRSELGQPALPGAQSGPPAVVTDGGGPPPGTTAAQPPPPAAAADRPKLSAEPASPPGTPEPPKAAAGDGEPRTVAPPAAGAANTPLQQPAATLVPQAAQGSGDAATNVPPALPAAADAKPPAPPAAGAGPRLAKADIEALVVRGDAFLRASDVITARLFYRRGADAGDATAALRLGETYDPAFLARARLAQVPGDRDKAQQWYRAARDLGSNAAVILLKSLDQAKK